MCTIGTLTQMLGASAKNEKEMKKLILILLSFGLFCSCKNGQTRDSLEENISDSLQITTTYGTERNILIQELNSLKLVFASRDKDKIADLFNFPIVQEEFGIYIDDSIFNKQLDDNKGKISKKMFIKFFPKIYSDAQIKQLNELFNKIDLEEIQKKDTLKAETKIKSEPCYKFYEVSVDKNEVTLTTGYGVNDDYQSKSTGENEIQENSSEFCESVLWWTFELKDSKLKFKRISGAG